MRHWALALIAALAVLTSGVASNASAADPNLLSNPSFEDTSDAVWNPRVAGSFSTSQIPIPTPIPDGDRFMLLIGYPGAPELPAISQDAGSVVPGATYNFSFSSTARSESSSGNIGSYGPLSALQFTASLVVRNGLSDTVIASVFVNPDLQSPSAWVKTSLSGTVPANATGNIVVKFVGTGFRGNDNQQTAIDLVELSIPAPVVAVPLTKQDCKNNGWQKLTDASGRAFKNQGDCVSYVATTGKNGANG